MAPKVRFGEPRRVGRDHWHGRRRPDVHRHHHLQVLRGGEHRVPVAVRVVDRGQAERFGVLGERERGRALGRAPLHLDCGSCRVPERDDDQRDVAAGHRAAPLVDHPVVVGLHAVQRELLVGRFPEHLPAEARERREAERAEDAGAVHVVEPRHGVVGGLGHLRVRDRIRRELLLTLPDRDRETGGSDLLPVVDPGVVDQPGHVVAPLGRCAGRPTRSAVRSRGRRPTPTIRARVRSHP